ncbi:hypothetical protein [Cellulosimicrobium sp. SJTW-1]|uniref:hypothetical protein n=1 Tax=Cellulosimicrobium sp. SJTW-1 TaxID=3078082 RepID=UPI0039E9DC45
MEPKRKIRAIVGRLEGSKMNTSDAIRELALFEGEFGDLSRDLGQKGDAAYLLVRDPQQPGRWAAIATPGDRWVSLEVAGGYSIDQFEQDVTDEDMRRTIKKYVQVALAYFRDSPAPARARLTGRSSLRVETESGDVVLRKSLADDLRDLLRRRRSS